MINRIDRLFDNARRDGKTAFLPFLTAGDPDLATTSRILLGIAERAASLGVPVAFEIGFPYSDPIADGATIQASYTRALDRGVRMEAILKMVADVRKATDAPMVGMVSYSLVYRGGAGVWLDRAAAAGLDGVIVPDLPLEEAAELSSLATARGLKCIQLVAPTTPPDRAAEVVKSSTGFVYSIAVTGITGERASLPPELPLRIDSLRKLTPLPLCVGFGVSRPAHVGALRGIADGVIVGSAIVRLLENATDDAGVQKVVDFAGSLMEPLASSAIA